MGDSFTPLSIPVLETVQRSPVGQGRRVAPPLCRVVGGSSAVKKTAKIGGVPLWGLYPTSPTADCRRRHGTHGTQHEEHNGERKNPSGCSA